MKLEDREDEDYVAPKKKPAPFSGTGQRLGDTETPTKTESNNGNGNTDTKANGSEDGANSSQPIPVDVDPNLPKVSIQVRLVDGSKVIVQLNEGHTIADLRK